MPSLIDWAKKINEWIKRRKTNRTTRHIGFTPKAQKQTEPSLQGKAAIENQHDNKTWMYKERITLQLIRVASRTI
jgi:hypothetical protein